jgi:hypothetical protein
MPSFGRACNDAVAAFGNVVSGHFGGKKGKLTAEDVSKRRAQQARAEKTFASAGKTAKRPAS